MIDTLLNLVFRCPHRRLTRPMAPITKAGTPHSQSYVVCLDCGKQFEYDAGEMRMGKAIDHTHEHAMVPPPAPASARTKFVYSLLAGLPAAVLVGVLWHGRKGKRAEVRDTERSPGRGARTDV